MPSRAIFSDEINKNAHFSRLILFYFAKIRKKKIIIAKKDVNLQKILKIAINKTWQIEK